MTTPTIAPSTWEIGLSNVNTETTELLASALDPEWVPENREELIRVFCALQATVARSGITGFPQHASDCFCSEGSASRSWRNSGDTFRLIATVVRDHMRSTPASTKVHPAESRGKLLLSTGEPITALTCSDDGLWSVRSASTWWPAAGPENHPDEQWVDVAVIL